MELKLLKLQGNSDIGPGSSGIFAANVRITL